MRKEDTKLTMAGIQISREKQLMDKRAKLEQQVMEEHVYAQLWMEDHDKKVERELREAREKKEKIGATLNILNWQADSRKQAEETTKYNKQVEQQDLREKWQRELETEK